MTSDLVDQTSPLATAPTECPAAGQVDSPDWSRTRRPRLSILGTRGIPARHGGFETFAERLALHLSGRGWAVTVYCQESGSGPITEDQWRGIDRIKIPVARGGPLGTIAFDRKSTLHAAGRDGLILTLGYNTALFCGWYRVMRRPNLINMDGLEWRRAKWNRLAKAWLYLNEWFGCLFGTRLIADHPEIARHLSRRVGPDKIVTIPYGADRVENADPAQLEPFGLSPRRYALVVARPEPENSLLEIVTAFSARRRGNRLVVLGRYEPRRNRYHARVMAAASDEVVFPGAIYDQDAINALRYFAALYIHGHTVGGTNPALVEALGAGCAVLARDNCFNRWVAGGAARFFDDEAQCRQLLDELLEDPPQLEQMRRHSRARHTAEFTWDRILTAYESLLLQYAVL
jgi:glycosyltransferase involved in cell wall biosynthesis